MPWTLMPRTTILLLRRGGPLRVPTITGGSATPRGPLPGASRLSLPQNNLGEGRSAGPAVFRACRASGVAGDAASGPRLRPIAPRSNHHRGSATPRALSLALRACPSPKTTWGRDGLRGQRSSARAAPAAWQGARPRSRGFDPIALRSNHHRDSATPRALSLALRACPSPKTTWGRDGLRDQRSSARAAPAAWQGARPRHPARRGDATPRAPGYVAVIPPSTARTWPVT